MFKEKTLYIMMPPTETAVTSYKSSKSCDIKRLRQPRSKPYFVAVGSKTVEKEIKNTKTPPLLTGF
jgi:hypothetical protein